MENLEKRKQYRQELFAQRTPYLQWLKGQEEKLGKQYGQQAGQGALGKQIHTLPFSSCMDSTDGYGAFLAEEIYLFVREGGRLADCARAVFADVFSENASAILVYADEDYEGTLEALYGEKAKVFDDAHTGAVYRGAPWFKPDFSPHTLASFFYIGSVFAIRGDVLQEARCRCGGKPSIYELVYMVCMEALSENSEAWSARIVHVPWVLYTNHCLADAGRTEGAGEIPALCSARGGQRTHAEIDKITIVIPSRDNAEVLRRCLQTLTQYTAYSSYEIVVVDNGSDAGQRTHITQMLDALKRAHTGLVVRYLYREAAFNFSAMCNAGAGQAAGEYLLFLNDDTEVMDTETGRMWLSRMMEYARMPHVGAVGAKLYYPNDSEKNDCYRIQHTGITNMAIGPAHKLGGMVDTGCLYHGHNTQNYDMLAVTAACMLIKKSTFEAAGGFDESFPVAYNDVALCFRLYQQGYFNVQVNEAVLIHHESLSRGQDTSAGKQRRLSAEKQRLYEKYPSLRARDPFYSPNLVQWKRDVEYNTGYLYDFDRLAQPVLPGAGSGRTERSIFRQYNFRKRLCATCRTAAKLYDRLTGYDRLMLCIDSVTSQSDDVERIVIEGWSAVRDADNAGISRALWLIRGGQERDFGKVYAFDIAPKLREDVAELLEGNGSGSRTQNTALSGMQVNIAKDSLEPGVYSIGVVLQGRLVCCLEKYVEIS